jgi:toxin ParE1/3/4
MKLRFTQRARRHLEEIADYIAQRNPDASFRVGRRIRETVELLPIFPHVGHQGTLAGTRELVVPGLPYIVVYRLEPGEESAAVILGIYHGSQLRPGQRPR